MPNLSTPILTTALSGPLHELERLLLENQIIIEDWLRQEWRKTPAPFYSSVDLRNAGFKLAPVDTNLFPAGFNNLNPDFLPLSIQAAQAVLEQRYPGCRRILLVPESHTRNQFYFANVKHLCAILSKAGYDVRIGALDPDTPWEKVIRTGNRIGVAGFDTCLVLLNNDLSHGLPDILHDLEQPIIPAVKLGWFNRLKTQHFGHYREVTAEFATLLKIDPWLIDPLFRACNTVDFMKRVGEEELMDQVDLLLRAIQKKYHEYHIPHKPFVVIKADAGTYGMGVMMVHDAVEIKQLNRKKRTRMMATKGNPITRVILQEGVYTFETWGADQAVAEPVVYMMGQHVIGGFYRVHAERGINENLNAPGMKFEPLSFAEPCNNPDPACCRFYAYGVIARLAVVAAAREMESQRV
ncbi:MAG: glutamate--cysteine ligase [Gammaproteobacteria bacterium]